VFLRLYHPVTLFSCIVSLLSESSRQCWNFQRTGSHFTRRRTRITMKLIFCALITSLVTANGKPNILFFLTDDLDSTLGGTKPLVKAKAWIRDKVCVYEKLKSTSLGSKGVDFVNSFVPTPICCPSRASILTGKYQHNTGVLNNSISGGCSSREWQKGAERNTLATELKGLLLFN